MREDIFCFGPQWGGRCLSFSILDIEMNPKNLFNGCMGITIGKYPLILEPLFFGGGRGLQVSPL